MSKSNKLILFIHGLTGSATKTWDNFPELLKSHSVIGKTHKIEVWEYTTGAIGKEPDLQSITDSLKTTIENTYSDYNEITLIAHSQGGLIARKYIADCLLLDQSLKVRKLLTFATPHLGSGYAKFLGKVPGISSQIKGLSFGSRFIIDVSKAWTLAKAETRILTKYVVAGDDAIVTEFSALGATWNKGYEVVTGEGHKSIVKPSSTADPSFQIAKKFILSERSPASFIEDDHRAPLLRYKRIEPSESSRFFFGAQVLEFVGREEELQLLYTFIGTPQLPFQWMLMHGSGGVGKSRLALELCLSVKEDWHAGFLDESADAPDWQVWQPILPTLIVIDYAAKNTENVAQFLSALSARGQLDGTKRLHAPVRVILIERTGRESDWFTSVIGTGEQEHRVTDTHWTPDIELATIQDPWLLIEGYLQKLGKTLPDRKQTMDDFYRIDPEGRPLFAHFLADSIAHGDDPKTLDSKRLLQDVIRRSRDKFWQPAGAGRPEERLLTLATIAGKIAIPEIGRLDGNLFPTWDIDRHPQVFSIMTGKNSGNHVEPLEPDIVGEALVLECLADTCLSDTYQQRLV